MRALVSKLNELELMIASLAAEVANEEEGASKVSAILDKVAEMQLAVPAPKQQKPKSINKASAQSLSTATRIEIVPISGSEFEEIPKYLRGRLTLDKLNSWSELLLKIFQEKYTVMQMNPARLAGEQRTRYYEWRDQDSEECRGQPFVTEMDMKVLCHGKGPKLDPTGRSIIAILRHCGRIREVRSAGIVRLVLN